MSLQTMIANLLLKLPPRWLVKLAGGKPVEIGGRVLDPHTQFIAHGSRNAPPMSSLSAQEAQAGTIATLAAMAADPEPGVAFRDFTIPGPNNNDIPVRSYTPADQDPSAPLMVYYHMGGGVVGDLDTCHVFCTILSKTARCPIVSVDYRLAPAHKFPAGLNDCIAAYEWGLRNAESYGAPAGMAAIGGDSMGGNFSAVIAQEMQRQGKPAPELQLLIYPATDIVTDYPSRELYKDTFSLSTDTMNWFMDHYLPEGQDRTDLLISPAGATDLSGLPAAIVVTAGFDPLTDEGKVYADRLMAAGVPTVFKCYDSLAHAFTAFGGFSPASDAACREIAGMVRDAYAGRAT